MTNIDGFHCVFSLNALPLTDDQCSHLKSRRLEPSSCPSLIIDVMRCPHFHSQVVYDRLSDLRHASDLAQSNDMLMVKTVGNGFQLQCVITSILTVRKSWTKGNNDLSWAYERAEAVGQTATLKSGETVLPRRTQLDPLQIRILWWQCWELLEAEYELNWEWKMPGEISHSGLYTIMGFTLETQQILILKSWEDPFVSGRWVERDKSSLWNTPRTSS